jgi:Mce-associated membrane protein
VPHDTEVDAAPGSEPTATAAPAAPQPVDEAAEPGRRRRGWRRQRSSEPVAVDDADADADADAGDRSRRPSLPLVPVLAVLLLLIAAACVALWVTRPDDSAVRTGDYVGALQAARAGIVDVTSFDYVTLDDDIAQIRNVTTGDLQQESVDQLDKSRQQITDAQAVVNTSVVGAAVGAADDDTATVFAVLQSTQQTSTSQQAQVQRYRVEITLTRVDGRWLLSGITGR